MSDLLVRHGPKLAVGGLVLLNVVLIGALVLRDPVSVADPADPVPASSPTLTATAAATEASGPPAPTPTPSASPTSTPTPAANKKSASNGTVAKPRLLAANSGRVARRAASTDCKGSAVVEVTTDAGRSWTKTKPGLTAIVRLTAYGDGSAFAIGADDKCRPTYAWTTGPTTAWRQDRSRVDDIWFRVPKDPDRVHAPGGGESRPCGEGLLDVASLDSDRAAALCMDGRVRTVTDGRSWKTVRTDSNVVALNSDNGRFVAAGNRKVCPGVLVQSFDSTGLGLEDAGGYCRPSVEPAERRTAVSRRSANLWLWSRDLVAVSQDRRPT